MATKSILVDTSNQDLTAYDGATIVYKFDCVTGDAVHPTPKGIFKILHKHAKYTSKKYKVPMDHAMFFTTTGEAIHEAHAVSFLSVLKKYGIFSNYIGSHGCVRLDPSDAVTLFKWAPIGTKVEVK
jgi:lipoprotein-anchoring transpeptidase ErfK/SrfK